MTYNEQLAQYRTEFRAVAEEYYGIFFADRKLDAVISPDGDFAIVNPPEDVAGRVKDLEARMAALAKHFTPLEANQIRSTAHKLKSGIGAF